MGVDMDKEIAEEIKIFSKFKIHLTIYIIVILITWLVWIAIGGFMSMDSWPAILTLGWGVIVGIHFLIAYRAFRKSKIKSE